MSYSYNFSLLKYKRNVEFARDLQSHFLMPALEVLPVASDVQSNGEESEFRTSLCKNLNRRPNVHTPT